MNDKWKLLMGRLPWLLLIFGVDGFAALLLWVIDASSFRAVSLLIFLLSLGLFAAIFICTAYKEEKRKKAMETFLHYPDLLHEEKLIQCSPAHEAQTIRLMGSILREKDEHLKDALSQLEDYEDFAEGWAHEVKTPLSLLVMMLDNRKEEMSPEVFSRLNYIRSSISENVSRMLYYARLKSAGKDYFFQEISLKDCILEVLEDYRPLLEEKKFRIHMTVPERSVFTDQRGILFLLSQIISNAVKYSGPNPELWIFLEETEEHSLLHIRDNGIGVKSCDLPYIFEKGFTGDSEDSRKKATGMGLYLSRKIAEDLCLRLEASSQEGRGFTMTVIFPGNV